jgi:hypothetical protein
MQTNHRLTFKIKAINHISRFRFLHLVFFTNLFILHFLFNFNARIEMIIVFCEQLYVLA